MGSIAQTDRFVYTKSSKPINIAFFRNTAYNTIIYGSV